MRRTTGCIAGSVLLVLCCGFASAQDEAAGRGVLDAATKAAQGVSSISYSAQLTTRTATRGRITIGQVVIDRLGPDDLIGGRLAVAGVQWPEGTDKRRPFNVRYDGKMVRSLDIRLKRVWEANPDEDGRAQPFRLTGDGRKLLEKAAPAWKKAQQQAKDLLGDGIINQLSLAVGRLNSDTRSH